MMQFTESAPPPPPLNLSGLGLCLDLTAPRAPLHRPRPWPGFPTSAKSLGSFNAAGCMEQLLVHCANAVEANDATLAQQLLWVLHNIAPPDGDSSQRLSAACLHALITRASRTGSCKMLTVAAARADADLSLHTHRFSAVDLASFIDLTPWHRFGYSAANAAIAEAVEGFPAVHIVDLGTTYCMQIPTLIDLLASRPEGPPILRITIPSPTATTALPPPILGLSYDELGAKLLNFARSKNVAMEFQVIPSNPADAFDTLIEQLRVQQLVSEGEALIVNCQMMLHYIPDETACAISSTMSMPSSISLRTVFLKALRSLEPTLVTLVDEDADFTASDVVGRLRAAFNYLWIPYDAVDTFLPKGSEQRRWYEAGVRWKIENVIAHEGLERVERQEPKGRWAQRVRAAGFRGVGFGEEAVGEVKAMLDEHSAGWGLKREEEDLVLTWKGHNVVFATAWVPS
ncbi:scarecrow-like protein 32 [Phoenix dactylifera]|uniref:Scarecrow-like protein 32 n=1 Tax=Phoenix dactylifera TaxID=42345 RepID=A0A8B9B2G1_PHODC|nr:scarecrow-like protein 32 [Phoenix dactylifera]